MVSVKRAGLLFVLFPLLGIIVSCLFFTARMRGSFTKWETLGRPAVVTSVKLIRIDYVKDSDTGDIYEFQNNPNCTDTCWIKVEALPHAPSQTDLLPVESCDETFDIPSVSNYSDYLIECSRGGGTGIGLTIQAIDHTGNVLMWRQGQDDFGDGFLILLSPILGGAVGLVLALFLFVIILIRILILTWPGRKTRPTSQRVQ